MPLPTPNQGESRRLKELGERLDAMANRLKELDERLHARAAWHALLEERLAFLEDLWKTNEQQIAIIQRKQEEGPF